MSKKKDIKTVKDVSSASDTQRIKSATKVSKVKGVEKSSAVQKTDKVSTVKGTANTQRLDFAKRDRYFAMVSEEADKLAKEGILPKHRRDVIERAVQVAIDAALLEPVEESDKKEKKDKK